MTLIKGTGTRFPTLFSDFFDAGKFFTPDYFLGNMLRKWEPSANITEDENEYTIELAAPGLAKEDFKIKIEKDFLTISAEKQKEKKEKGEKFTRQEFSYSTFSRAFMLPDDVNAENISGKYENGLLVLVLPKNEIKKKGQVKEIKIS